MVAPRSGINSAPAPAPEEPPLLDVTKQSGNSDVASTPRDGSSKVPSASASRTRRRATP